MTTTRTAAATAAASRARSRAALERKLTAAATLLYLNGWYLAGPDEAARVRDIVAPNIELEWLPGHDVR